MKALLFDLDGTLADSTYQHVAAWTKAFRDAGLQIPVVDIHRRVGMNGALLLKALDRTFALGLSQTQRDALERAHANAFALVRDEVILAAGADRVSEELERLGIRMAIVTSGSHDDAQIYFDRLKLTPSTLCITREDEARSKPSSNQLHRAFKQLRVDPHDAALVGDSTWDMLASRTAGSFGIGVLSGGYSREELTSAGAFRVYRDVAELLKHLEEIGIESA
ncbi:MAG TPA: HAD family hydrolase [Candidatus Acidoferrales bacterium]|nr:HAD family hydrolase [Candidatus Acidoferrales bacterium]